MKTTEYINILRLINKSNPNKLSIVEIAALEYVTSQLGSTINFLKHKINKGEKVEDRAISIMDLLEGLDRVTWCILDSNLLKPIRGLVINRDRVRNNQELNYIEKQLIELKALK